MKEINNKLKSPPICHLSLPMFSLIKLANELIFVFRDIQISKWVAFSQYNVKVHLQTLFKVATCTGNV